MADSQPNRSILDRLNLDTTNVRVEPGRVNAHTHIYSGLVPLGLPAPAEPPATFLEILGKIWWRLDRALDPATLRAAARFYVAEALLAGTTTLVDHNESPTLIDGSLEVLADACTELGMRAVLTYGATERNGGRDEARQGLAECRRFFTMHYEHPLLRGVVGLHASFTVSDETVREAGALCRELGVPLHIHVAEDGADVLDAKARGYAGPVERLIALDALPARSILAHGVHLSADQVRAAAERGCWFVQNPRSNEGNRVGYPFHLRESNLVALGTDGWAADMGEEEAALQRLGTAHGDDPDRLGQRPAAGRPLVAGLFGQDPDALDDWTVIEEGTGAVRHTVIAGRPVVKDGVLQTADIAAIRAEAEVAAPKLWERMAER